MEITPDSNENIFEEKNSIDLITELSLKKHSKYKKALFEFYLICSHNWVKNNLTKLLNFSAYCGIAIKQLQFQSLVLLSTTKKSSSSYDQSIEDLLNNIRFDLIFIKYTTQNSVTFTFLSIVFILASMFILIYFQLIAKKRLFIKVFIIIFGSLSWTIENYLMIPMVTYSSIYIQHSLFTGENYVDVYNKTLEFNPLLGLLFILQLGLLFLIVVMNTVFNYTSGYSYETAYSRAHSIVSLKQIIFLFFLSIIHIIVPKSYFLYLTSISGIYMIYSYLRYLSYYSLFDNFIDSGLWLTLLISSILSLLNEITAQGFETVIVLLIILPFAYFLLWTSLQKSLSWQVYSQPQSPFMYELKIRKICKKNDLTEAKIEKVRSLFNECTKNFIEYKLIYIWECNFELKFTGNNELAMIKLLKIIFSTKRPKFLQNQPHIFKNFPDIESEFLFYKLFKKLRKLNSIKEFELLKQLKKYSKSIKLDLIACDKLIKVLDANLNSKEYTTKQITSKIIELYNALNEKDLTLGKYLKNNEDTSIGIEKYKTFRDQLFYSNNSKIESQEENYIEKMMGLYSDNKNAKMILSGDPERIGTIIYVNKNCAEFLSPENHSLIIGKSFISLIVQPLQAMHEYVLERLLLFGNKIEFKRDYIVVQDIKGHAIEVSMSLKIVFYAQTPYFLIDFLQKLPKEKIILFEPNGEILTYSEELSQIITPGCRNIEDIFKNLTETIKNQPLNTIFVFSQNNQSEILKLSELQISATVLKVLHIYDENYVSKYYLNSEFCDTIKKRNSVLNKISLDSSPKLKSKTSFIKKRKQFGLDNTFCPEIYKFNDDSIKIRKICKILRLGNFFINFLNCSLFIIFVVIQIKFSDFDNLSQAVEDLGIMRGCIVRISTNFRSLDLLKYQEGVYYDFSNYKEKLLLNSEELKERLLDLDKFSSVFPVEKKLKNEEIFIVECYNNTFSLTKSNLYQGILDLNLKVTTWIASDMNDKDALLYIYNNAFFRLFTDLNNLIYRALDEIQLKTAEFFWFLIKIKSIIFIPLAILLIISLVSLYFLARINRQQWNFFNNASTPSLLQIRIKVVERIKMLNESFVSLDPEKSRQLDLFEHFWIWYILGYCFLFTLSLFFCIIIVFSIEQPLFYFNLTRINYTFWSGSSLSLIFNCFLWGREEYLKETSYSYASMVTDYYQSATPGQILTKYNNDLDSIEKYTLDQMNTINTKGYDFHSFYTYYLGIPCKNFNIINCSTSILSKGIHPALLLYLQDLEFLTNSSYSKNSPLLKKIEFNLETIFSALVTSFTYLSDKIQSYTSYFTNLSIILCIVWIILLQISYKFIQKQSIQQIEISLLSKNKLILLLQNSRLNKTQQSLDDSQPSHISHSTITK